MKTAKRNLFRSAAVAGMLVATASCDDEPGEPSLPAYENAGFRGFPLTSQIWDQTNIPVCWENLADSTAEERGWVRDAVAETWEAHSEVMFAGWGQCAADAEGIRILVVDEGPRVNALGKSLDGLPNGMWLNFTYNNWNPACSGAVRACSEDIAVHEFGHALGFAHEQNRDDSPGDCTAAPQGQDGDVTVGAWDLASVMNYCNPDWNGNGSLSEGDIEMVQAYYGPGRPRVGVETSVPHGGNLWENWWEQVVGGACAPGTVRAHFDMSHTGHGNCDSQWSEWLSDSAEDCRVRVVGWNSGGWLDGQCHVAVYERPLELSSNWDQRPGVCRDASGAYPRWSAFHDVTLNACLQACVDEPACQGAAYDESRRYCQTFGTFGDHGASAPGTTVTEGDLDQPGFECYLNRGFTWDVTPGVCRDDQGNYPRWGSLSPVTLDECLETCSGEPDCQGAAFDPSRDYCQVFGSFAWYGASSPGTVITGGDMNQPDFKCYAR